MFKKKYIFKFIFLKEVDAHFGTIINHKEQLLGGSLCGAQIPQKVPGCIQI